MQPRYLFVPVVAVALLAAGSLKAAPDADLQPAAPKRNETRVPIPGWSPEVASNGCPIRNSPDEASPAGRAGIPFWGLVDHAVGRHAVRAAIDGPAKFQEALALLDDDMRRLTLLVALWQRFGRDGLHTFFFLDGGNHAPAIRDALKEAGFAREFELFSRALALFGAPYPADRAVRAKLFGYSRPGGNLNAFDHALLPIAQEFGTRAMLAQRIVEYVNRTPALFARIEALRAKLGENDRLRHLADGLAYTLDWRKDVARQLAARPAEERHLIALWIFNAEFENGGIHQFFYNSAGDIAPEVHEAMHALDLAPQAEIFARALAMFGPGYSRDHAQRRKVHFKGEWSGSDEKLAKLTDDFYAIGGGAQAYRIKGDLAFEGGPGFRHAMLRYARSRNMLPC
jgi:hypothetical protein